MDIFISTGIHELEAMTWYAGSKVKHVYGESVKVLSSDLGKDDANFALLRFDSGAVGNLESGWLLPPTEPARLDSRFDIVSSKGCIYIENANKRMMVCNEEGYHHLDLAYWPVLGGQAVGTLRESLTHWLSCLLEDREPMVGAREGRLAVQLVLAIQEWCSTGMPVDLQ